MAIANYSLMPQEMWDKRNVAATIKHMLEFIENSRAENAKKLRKNIPCNIF